MSNPDEKAPLSERLDGYTNGYLQLSIYALITGVVIILAARWLNRLMEDKTQ
jgi:POT family proton-dependent oligopeptide transporter